ncbi:hypothetical protein HDE_04837 [Halotydeus destructor]|nr:hypothetical protein HDE_04837 [Halotydeus destructor]
MMFVLLSAILVSTVVAHEPHYPDLSHYAAPVVKAVGPVYPSYGPYLGQHHANDHYGYYPHGSSYGHAHHGPHLEDYSPSFGPVVKDHLPSFASYPHGQAYVHSYGHLPVYSAYH